MSSIGTGSICQFYLQEKIEKFHKESQELKSFGSVSLRIAFTI